MWARTTEADVGRLRLPASTRTAFGQASVTRVTVRAIHDVDVTSTFFWTRKYANLSLLLLHRSSFVAQSYHRFRDRWQ